MSTDLAPQLDSLPAAQQRLWPHLRPAAGLGFVLYGGTAVALRLGHRVSVDFDFFTERPLVQEALREAFPEMLGAATVLQEERNALTVLVPSGAGQGPVKVSFFGGLTMGRVGLPQWTQDRVMLVASPVDLLATKLKVILQRAEAKDYHDIAALLLAGQRLDAGLAAGRALYGAAFQPGESLKALTYFEDGDLAVLPLEVRHILVSAVLSVSDLPVLARLSQALGDHLG